MSDETEQNTDADGVDLPDFSDGENPPQEDTNADTDADAASANFGPRTGTDLEAVFDVPVKLSAVLGKTKMEVSSLLNLTQGAVIELDRKVGEAIDIYVNNRLIARGEVVLVEEKLGITMTEIIQTD